MQPIYNIIQFVLCQENIYVFPLTLGPKPVYLAAIKTSTLGQMGRPAPFTMEAWTFLVLLCLSTTQGGCDQLGKRRGGTSGEALAAFSENKEVMESPTGNREKTLVRTKRSCDRPGQKRFLFWCYSGAAYAPAYVPPPAGLPCVLFDTYMTWHNGEPIEEEVRSEEGRDYTWCQEKCELNPACDAWTLNTLNGWCGLKRKDQVKLKKGKKNFISGRKGGDCPDE